MPKIFTSKTQKTGELGETLAVKYLEGKGFTLIERNYTKKWGEIDIVARKGRVIHFIEVKAKSVIDCNVKLKGTDYRPEENMHYAKVGRLKRTIQTYLLERNVITDWQFDLALVYMSDIQKQARVELMENVIL